jgi:hypothetical protein
VTKGCIIGKEKGENRRIIVEERGENKRIMVEERVRNRVRKGGKRNRGNAICVSDHR